MNAIPVIAPDTQGISRAVQALGEGLLVGMPTETVYGLAADAGNASAVARIYAAKKRPHFNPLIAHVASLAAAQKEGQFDQRAIALAKAFWPGPLTLVVPISERCQVCDLARAGLDTVGLRMPAHPVAGTLIQNFDGPLVAPSANLSGRLSPTTADHVAAEFGAEVALILDGGPCSAGIESTIVSVAPGEPIRLLRPGALSRQSVEEVIGLLADGQTPAIVAPGQLASHYAPKARVRLNALAADPGEVLLGFGPEAPPDTPNLSRNAELLEAATNLYRMLRELDATGVGTIAVMPIPETGLGEAINDRLRRAAAPRET